MIVDIHTHTFPDHMAARTVHLLGQAAHIIPQTDATVDQLLASGEKAGVDLSVILPVATKASQVESINRSAAEINAVHQGRGILSFGAMHPEYEHPEKELERIAAMGMKGIKIHPVYQGQDIDSPAYVRILRKAAELGLAVVTHAGQDIGFPGVIHCSPEMCRHVMDLIPSLKLILAHMGGWHDWDEVPHVLKDTPVFLDTAFSLCPVHTADDGHWPVGQPYMLSEEQFVNIIRAFGSERVLFGTDCPWADQSDYVKAFRNLPLTEQEKADILGNNAVKLLNLNKPV